MKIYNNVVLRGTVAKCCDELEEEKRIGMVLLGRPYHNDPGINHEILEEFQKAGLSSLQPKILCPSTTIFWTVCLERKSRQVSFSPDGYLRCLEKFLQREHQPEDLGRQICSPASQPGGAGAVESSSVDTMRLSTTVVEEIVENSGTPYFCFKDIDENKPSGSIKIRVETISYFLKRYREDMVAKKTKRITIEERLQAYEQKLREELYQQYAAAGIGPELVGVGSCGPTESGERLLQLTLD